MKLQQKLFSFRLFVSIMCFIGIIFGGVMTFFFQDMFNAILANVSYIFFVRFDNLSTFLISENDIERRNTCLSRMETYERTSTPQNVFVAHHEPR